MISQLESNPAAHLYGLHELAAMLHIAFKEGCDIDINTLKQDNTEVGWFYEYSLVSMSIYNNLAGEQLLRVTMKDDYDYCYSVDINMAEGSFQSETMSKPMDLYTDWLAVEVLRKEDKKETLEHICPRCKGDSYESIDCPFCGGDGTVLQEDLESYEAITETRGHGFCGVIQANVEFGDRLGIIYCPGCEDDETSAEFNDNHTRP